MQAAEIYLGVGRLHPRVSLQFEMRMHGMGGYKEVCRTYWVNALRIIEAADC